MKQLVTLLAVAFGILAQTSWTTDARANDVATRDPAVATKDETAATGFNWTLLRSGIWILGLSYTPAVIVAAESNRYGDKGLYVPVAGPWLDLASRKSCPMTVACTNETTNKMFIIVDGVFQSLGAFNIVGAFIFPEARTVPVSSSEQSISRISTLPIRVFPTRVGTSAYGFAAVVTF